MAEKILSKSVKAVTRCAQSPYKTYMLPQPANLMGRCLLIAMLAMCWLLATVTARASIVEIQTAEKITAAADFHQGQAGKPAVLILHGFLQTRDFGIVKIIADSLKENGYTVLSPTLSLGISLRKRSLDCKALHLHDMDGDLREIQLWAKWLHGRGHERIIGLGHSFGATQLLAWRERYQEKNVDLIGVSLVGSSPLDLGSGSSPARKNALQRRSGAELVHAPLSFCESYTAPASKYASYSQWDENRILATLTRSSSRTDLIQGTADKFVPSDWGNRLGKTTAHIHRIPGANHFMDGTAEFDMLDTILGLVKR